ncbi:MAG TPA: serine hydrolase domain-containing protein [Rhizomicrobium sp.]|nr:serine hydrolase domain-containing protein [Rhizomicrobium sp.]
MKATPLLLASLFATAAHAADYKPVSCDMARPYAGAPLLSPAGRLDLRVSGDLDGDLDAAIAARLKKAFQQAMSASRARSLTVAVGIPGIGLWSAEGTPEGSPPAAPLHYWASAGKTLTALTVLKLVETGKLSLHDPIAKFVAGVPNGSAITIEMLLNHTSGLFSVNEDLQVRRRERMTLEESLRVLRRHGAMFCPGEQWRYTNSGYDLLGRIIEIVEQHPFDQALTAHIVAPLGLQQLRVLRPNDPATDIAPLSSSNPAEPALDPRIPGAAGPLAAKAADVVRFWHAVLSDKIVSRTTRERMLARLYPMFGKAPYYGLGVMVYEVPGDGAASRLWVGHSGGAPGVKAMFAYSPLDNAFVAVALSGDGSAEATAYLLMRALRAP